MKRLFLVLSLLSVLFAQTGCSSTDTAATRQNNIDGNGEPVSSVPWNTPASWETQGQLGALSH